MKLYHALPALCLLGFDQVGAFTLHKTYSLFRGTTTGVYNALDDGNFADIEDIEKVEPPEGGYQDENGYGSARVRKMFEQARAAKERGDSTLSSVEEDTAYAQNDNSTPAGPADYLKQKLGDSLGEMPLPAPDPPAPISGGGNRPGAISFAEIANELLNDPQPAAAQQQPPQYNAYNPYGYPQPPADPNNPNAQQPYYPPPPPQYNPYNPYGYPPPPPPPGFDPNDPNAQQQHQPYFQQPYNPYGYYPPPPPPPPAFDPNDPNAQQQAYQNPYGYQPYGYPYPYPPPPPPPGYGYPNAQQMPPQGQVPPPPPQQQQQQLQEPDLTTLPKHRVRPGAKVGRNRDADNIANTADLYFAQLKLDSTIRKKAFLSGDSESSNDIFGDARVKQLKETLLQNPAMKREMERKKQEEQKLIDAAAEEFFDEQNNLDRQKPNARTQGRMSYKEKLEQSRLKKEGL